MRREVQPARWRDRRVLVTGHTGFKGAWLSLWLECMGARVTGFSHAVTASPSLHELLAPGSSVSSVLGDVRDAEAVRACVGAAAPEVVFHLAAQPLVRRSYAEPVDTVATNVLGTATLLDALRAAPSLRAVVVVSSDKCYRNRETGQPYAEDDPLGGHDPYSASKAAQEIVAAAWRSSYALPLATARAGNVIGGGDWGQDRLVPDAARAVAAGEPLVVRRPHAVRPWQHVLCALEGYLLLAEALLGEQDVATAWNFGPSAEDCRPVEEVLGRLVALWPQLRWEARPDPGPVHEAGLLRLDATRARTALGWSPAWNLERGLAAVAAWYRAHLAGEDMRARSLDQLADYIQEG